ncbi:MAG: hypothetical protein AAF585_26400, partial [Verrucomicrobiota bacterium]
MPLIRRLYPSFRDRLPPPHALSRPRPYVYDELSPALTLDFEPSWIRQPVPSVDQRFLDQTAGPDQTLELPADGRIEFAAYAVSVPGIQDEGAPLFW